MIRVLFTGSRYASPYQDGHRATIWSALLEVHRAYPDGTWFTLVHGDAPGADRMAAAYAAHLGWAVEPYPADWDGPCGDRCQPNHRTARRGRPGTYCPAAGAYRNQRMVDLGADVCVATPMRYSRGTRDCVRRAKAAGIPVVWRNLPDREPMVEGVFG